MKKAMFSSPMNGLSHETVCANQERARQFIEAQGYEFVNTVFEGERWGGIAMEQRGVVHVPLNYLAKSLENMSECHAVYFMRGWENARGCRVEHEAAKAYGLEIIYE